MRTITTEENRQKNSNSNSKKLNNLYFNDYIDIQFRVMNPNSRIYNSYKKDEAPYYIKNYNTGTGKNNSNNFNNEKAPGLNGLTDLIKISNYKNNQNTISNDFRKVKSARVKI
jgi:hypothetical protein